MWIFVALVALPVLEIALFIVVGGRIGLWPTLALVLAGGIAGAVLLRAQGIRALLEAQRQAARGEDPSVAALGAALAVTGAALLMAPGFLSDALGLALLVPAARGALAAWLAPRMTRIVVVASGGPGRPDGFRRRPPGGGASDGDAIEVEYREIDDEPAPRRDPPP